MRRQRACDFDIHSKTSHLHYDVDSRMIAGSRNRSRAHVCGDLWIERRHMKWLLGLLTEIERAPRMPPETWRSHLPTVQ